MKKTFLLLMTATGMALSSCNPTGADFKDEGNGGVEVTRIDPTDWYVGMKDPTVQLMAYGKDIRDAEVSVQGAKIDSLVRLDSPNYLLLYLDLSQAKAGELPIAFKRGDDKTIVRYQLKEREMKGEERQGFTNADVLYMLMPDRFAQSEDHPTQIDGLNDYVENRAEPSLRHGGDLEGIRQHLDYFNDLGVTALWFTPVLENNSPDSYGGKVSTYHGYATTDYYRVDPRFGTNDDYRRLIDDAHQHGLKVVMDMIFNHSGFEHPWVSDMPSKDWFNNPEWLDPANQTEEHMIEQRNMDGVTRISNLYRQTSYKLTPVLDPYASEIDKAETTDGWFVPTMPDLNQRNPHVIRYLIQNSEWWIETVGIDGIRMDTYPYADRTAMSQWMKVLDEEYPNFNTVGETWVTEPAYTAAWQKGSRLESDNSYLKTVMDFSFFDKLNQARYEETDGWWHGFNRLYNSFVYDYLYEDPSHVMAFIENHDTDRFLGDGHAGQDKSALKQALALLLTVQRIPQLYYGTEVLMNGTKAQTDGNVRKDFPGGFKGDKHNCFTANGRTADEQEMFQWLSTLLHWRQGNETIIRGYQTQFCPWKGVYVVARRWHRNCVMTILNGTNQPTELDWSRYKELIDGQTEAQDILTGQHYTIGQPITLEPRATMVLEF